MKRTVLMAGAAMVLGATSAFAHTSTYNVTLTFYEPDTQPRNTIFKGIFDFDEHTHAVSNLQGMLSESMTGDPFNAGPNGDYGMTWLNLSNQLQSWHDATLGGTFTATFLNTTTATFFGGTWTPADGVAVGGIYSGWPNASSNPGNAYALIFVPDDPLTPLTQAQIDKLAYADCAPGGMMGAVCMTGTTIAGYGAVGTMSGYPLSQIISLAPVPEPESYAMLLAGLGLVGFAARRQM
jgi:hypothetical protein